MRTSKKAIVPADEAGRLAQEARQRARSLGFDAFGVADARAPWEAGARLQRFLDEGRHGAMAWMASRREERAHPAALWPEARCAVVVGTSYAPDVDLLAERRARDHGVVSVYAARRDYHDTLKGRLKQLAAWLAASAQGDVKVFVDTAPLMEKPLAQRAGLGWQGKHTNLVSREHGSWLFLGVILCAFSLSEDAPQADACGTCQACVAACPTDAFPAPYQLDARRCIAYLTIEHPGVIAKEFREAMGDRIFGCDDCLAVCPWNKFAKASRDTALALKEDLRIAPLSELAGLDDAQFRARFAGTPVKRTGRDRFVRNVLIAIGNSGDERLVATAERLTADAAPLVRGMAAWALSRLLDGASFDRLKSRALAMEPEAAVREEWGG